jgi:hypothetical protein
MPSVVSRFPHRSGSSGWLTQRLRPLPGRFPGRQLYAFRTFIFAKNLGVYGPFYLSTLFSRVCGGGCASTSFSYSCSCSLSPWPSATCTYHHSTAPINTSRFRRAPGMAFRGRKKLHLITVNYGELHLQLRPGNYSTAFGVPIDRGCAFSVPRVENRRPSRTSNQTQSHFKKLAATTPLGAARHTSNSEVLGIIPKVATTPGRSNCELLGIEISGTSKIPSYSHLFGAIPSQTVIPPESWTAVARHLPLRSAAIRHDPP